MQTDLFSKPAEYVIDSCSLMAMFNNEPWTFKAQNPGLWVKVEELMLNGTIISHVEVLCEIKSDGANGEGLFTWANSNSTIFKQYDYETEGKVIRRMSGKYGEFVNGGFDSCYADPWIIAQAKVNELKLITQEKRSESPYTKNFKIPNICEDSNIDVKCLDLWELAVERGWKFHVH